MSVPTLKLPQKFNLPITKIHYKIKSIKLTVFLSFNFMM